MSSSARSVMKTWKRRPSTWLTLSWAQHDVDVARTAGEAVGLIRRLQPHLVTEAPQAPGQNLRQMPITPPGGDLRRRGRDG
jgi:hypothetical protein